MTNNDQITDWLKFDMDYVTFTAKMQMILFNLV